VDRVIAAAELRPALGQHRVLDDRGNYRRPRSVGANEPDAVAAAPVGT
jgi:hypothetical protein